MMVKCPHVPLVFVALRVVMGNISTHRYHTSKYLDLSLHQHSHSKLTRISEGTEVAHHLQNVGNLIVCRQRCAWEGMRRNFLTCDSREGQLELGACWTPAAETENRGSSVVKCWGDDQQTALGGCLHSASFYLVPWYLYAWSIRLSSSSARHFEYFDILPTLLFSSCIGSFF